MFDNEIESFLVNKKRFLYLNVKRQTRDIKYYN